MSDPIASHPPFVTTPRARPVPADADDARIVGAPLADRVADAPLAGAPLAGEPLTDAPRTGAFLSGSPLADAPRTETPAGPIDDLARALHGLSALRRDLQRCTEIEHAVAGLTVLTVVRRIGPARVSDVAHETQVNLSVASRQIQALEEEGSVARVADPRDGRSSLIGISPAGEAKLGRAHARLTGVLATATAGWRHDEITGLADGLVRLRAALAPSAAVPAAAPTLPADRPAAGPTLTSAQIADARHEEHTR